MGEDVGLRGRTKRAATHSAGNIEGLPSHDGCINGSEEAGHRVVLRHEEKVDGTVWARDVPVEADTESQDNVAHVKIVHDLSRYHVTGELGRITLATDASC